MYPLIHLTISNSTKKNRLFRRLFAFVLIITFFIPALLTAKEIEQTMADFNLRIAGSNRFIKLSDAARSSKYTVIIFVATRCPYSNAYNERMRELAKLYRKKGISFIGINSNKTEPEQEIQSHARKNGFPFPVLIDAKNRIADKYQARKTPEVYVVNRDLKLLYQGRIDENYQNPSEVRSPDLKNALEDLLQNKKVRKAKSKAFGCSIKRI